MRPRIRHLAGPTPFACALAVALALPGSAVGQQAPAAAQTASAVRELPLPAAERGRFVGTVVLSDPGSPQGTMPFRIFEENGALYGEPQGGQAMRLLYQGDNAFRPEHEPQAVLTFTVEGERADRFRVTGPQGVLEGKRVADGGR